MACLTYNMDYIYSSTHLLEIDCHQKYVSQATNCIVEIGVLDGATTKQFLDIAKCKVYGIDPIIIDSNSNVLIGDLNKINNLEKHYSSFTFIKDYSFNVVKTWKEPIDYIFIDGDHNYEAVKKDMEDWFSHVKQGGYMSFHDSAANRGGPSYWPGPSKLTDELIHNKKMKYIETVWSLTVFQKI
jgi:hypothetical protein